MYFRKIRAILISYIAIYPTITLSSQMGLTEFFQLKSRPIYVDRAMVLIEFINSGSTPAGMTTSELEALQSKMHKNYPAIKWLHEPLSGSEEDKINFWTQFAGTVEEKTEEAADGNFDIDFDIVAWTDHLFGEQDKQGLKIMQEPQWKTWTDCSLKNLEDALIIVAGDSLSSKEKIKIYFDFLPDLFWLSSYQQNKLNLLQNIFSLRGLLKNIDLDTLFSDSYELAYLCNIAFQLNLEKHLVNLIKIGLPIHKVDNFFEEFRQELFASAISVYEGNLEPVESLLKVATEKRRDGRLVEAETIYREVFDRCKSQDDISAANLGLAKIYEMQGKHLEAIQFASNSIKFGNSNDLSTLLWLISNVRLPVQEKLRLVDQVLKMEAERVSEKDQYLFPFAKVCAYIALGDAEQDQPINYKAALEIACKIESRPLQALAHVRLGSIKVNARHNYQQALKLASELKNASLQAEAYIGLADAWENRQSNYVEGLNIALRLRNRLLQAKAYIGLGSVGVNPRENYEKALPIALELKDKNLQAKAQIGLGEAGVEAVLNFLKGVNIAIEIKDPFLEAQARIGLGNVGFEKWENFGAAKSIAEQLGDGFLKAKACIGLGDAARDVNIKKIHYTEASKTAKAIGALDLQIQADARLAEIALDSHANRAAVLEIERSKTSSHLQAQTLRDPSSLGSDSHSNYVPPMSLGLKSKAVQLDWENCIRLAKLGVDTEANYRKALEFGVLRKDRYIQALAYMGLANAGILPPSNFEKARKLAAALEDLPLQAEAHLGLGYTTRDKVAHFKEALRFATKTGDLYLQSLAHLGLADSNDEPSKRYNLVKKNADLLKNKNLEARALSGLASLIRNLVN